MPFHAKCIVVDERWAFVTRANFTEADQERNLEAGVPRIAEALSSRFPDLREAGPQDGPLTFTSARECVHGRS